MIHAGVANQDRPLCDPVSPFSVFRASLHSVLIVDTATGTVKFKNLRTHEGSKLTTTVMKKNTGNSRLDGRVKVDLVQMY